MTVCRTGNISDHPPLLSRSVSRYLHHHGVHRLSLNHPDIKYVRSLFKRGKLTGDEDFNLWVETNPRLKAHHDKKKKKNMVEYIRRNHHKWIISGVFFYFSSFSHFFMLL